MLAWGDGNLKRKNLRCLDATCGGWVVENGRWTKEKTIPCDCGGVFHVLCAVVINRNVKKTNNNHEPSHGFFPFICLLRVLADIFVLHSARDLGVPHAVLSVVTWDNTGRLSPILSTVSRGAAPCTRSWRKSIWPHATTWAVRETDFVRNKPFCDRLASLQARNRAAFVKKKTTAHRQFYYSVLLTL